MFIRKAIISTGLNQRMISLNLIRGQISSVSKKSYNLFKFQHFQKNKMSKININFSNVYNRNLNNLKNIAAKYI